MSQILIRRNFASASQVLKKTARKLGWNSFISAALSLLILTAVFSGSASAQTLGSSTFSLWGVGEYISSFFNDDVSGRERRAQPFVEPDATAAAGIASGSTQTNLASPCANTGVFIDVNPGESIQTAINNSDPAGGDTIRVAAGTYTEQLFINKCLTIKGAGQAATLIQSPATLVDSFVPGVTAQSIVEVRSNSYVTIEDLTVTGPVPFDKTVYGIFVIENSTLKMTNARVTAIHKAGGIDGVQNGNAVRAGSVSFNQIGTLDFNNVTIDDYQKTAIIVSRAGSTATIANSAITGAGAQTAIAQNGIQVSDGATATITNNTIGGNVCDNPACSFSTYYSYAILGAQSGAMTISGNTINNNDAGILSWHLATASASTVSGNLLTNSRYAGIDLDQGTTNVTNNYVVGSAFGPVVGVGAYSYDGNTTNTIGNLQMNSITGASQTNVGLYDFNTGDTAIPTVTANFNRLSGSAGGVTNTTTTSTVNAENNFWGCNGGPGTPGCSTISNFVDADPWLVLDDTTATQSSVNTGDTTVVTTSLRKNSDGTDTYALPGNPHLPNPLPGIYPNGIPVNFSATNGTVSPTVTPLVDGLASTTFTGGGVFSGDQTAVVTATVDNASDTVNITVDDTTNPTVTINQAAGQPDPTNTSPVNFTVVFSENVGVSFTGADVTLGGTAGATTATVTETGAMDGTTFNVAVSGMTQNGTVTASIAPGAATDSAGNGNNASTSTDNSVAYFLSAIEFVVDDLGVNCLNNSAPVYTTIQAAVAAANPGYIIRVCSGTYSIGSNIPLNKAGLTIIAAEAVKPLVNVSGSGNSFTVSASNITIDGLNIVKTDAVGTHNIITVQGTNFSGKNNDFTATTPWQTSGVTRGYEISGTATGLLINGNTFTDVRQPAYINGDGNTLIGTVSNNTATRTKGFVVDGALINFTGNTFGQTCSACDTDIALLNNASAAYQNFYLPNALAISAANDNAHIDIQFTAANDSGRAVSYVDDSAAPGGDGRVGKPYQIIQQAIYLPTAGIVDGTLPGGTVNVAAGTYPETIVVSRPLKILGAQTGVLAKPRSNPAAESTIVVDLSGTPPVNLQADDITFDGFNFDINQTFPTASNSDKPGAIIVGNGNPGPGGDGYQNIKILNNRLPYNEGNADVPELDRQGVFLFYATNLLIEGNYFAGFPGQAVIVANGSMNFTYRNNDSFNNSGSNVGTQGNFGGPTVTLDHTNVLIENNRADQDSMILFLLKNSTIRNNTLTAGPLGSSRVYLGGGSNNVSVENNTFTLTNNAGIVSFDPFGYGPNSNINSVGNTLTRSANATTTGSFSAIDYRGTGGTNNITNNTVLISGALPVNNSTYAIRIRGSASGNFNINGNTLDGGNVTATGTAMPRTAGLYITSNATGTGGDAGIFPASSTITGTCNTFTRFQDGITVYDAVNNTPGGLQSSNVAVNNSNIVGNSQFGVNNGGTSATINAQNNYWGAADGPGPVGPGSGDRVTPNVDFSNFQSAPVSSCTNLPPPPPTVTINQAAGQSDPTSASQISFDVVFSEAVTGFDASDVDLTGSSAFAPGDIPVINVSGSGSTYTVTVSGMTRSGTVTAKINSGAAMGANGASVASTSADNTVNYNFAVANPGNTVQQVNPVNITTQQFRFLNEGANGSGAFVTGPGTPPSGNGSVQLTVDSTGRQNLVTNRYAGTRFADITALIYSAYTNRTDNLTISLQFDADFDLNDTNTGFQGRLVYEPAAQAITVTPNTFQTFDTTNGRFYATRAPFNNPDNCSQANPCTRAKLLALFPNVGIRATTADPNSGILILRAGGPFPGGMIANADNLVVGVNGATTTFDFEPAPPTVSISDATAVTEGNAGTTTATFTVSISQVSQLDTTVTVSTADGTATTANGDYAALPADQTVIIPAGQTSTTVTVNVNGDTNVEGNETFTVNLSNALNAAIADGQGVGTINNDDVVISFSAATYNANEPDGTATITVTRSGATPNSETVNFATSNGTATGGAACTAGVDFINNSGTLTFAGNETSKTFAVTVCNDIISEAGDPETVNLTLSNPSSGAMLGTSSAVLNIFDNDGAGVVTIAGNIQQYNAPSANTNLPGVTVTLSGSASATTTTDSNGNYSFTGLAAGGSYKVTPSGLGKIYDPIYRNYSGLNVNVTDANFIAYNSINDVPRRVRIGLSTVTPGQQVSVPIRLESLGNENGVSFSLTYDATRLSNPVVTLGADAPAGSSLITNPGTGVIGIIVTAPSGQTFGAAGLKEIVRVQFNTAPNTDFNTPLTFTDSPIVRSVNDIRSNPLQAQFINGVVVFAQGLESDVDTRPNGDGDVDLGDYIQTGRFAANLDTPDFATSNEFQRADSEPSALKGDADVDLGDFIQAGRYAAFLDPVQTVGGPAYPTNVSPFAATTALTEKSGRVKSLLAIPRVVRVVDVTALPGSQVTVSVEVEPEAGDLGVSFTMDYETTKLSNPQVALGSGAPGATLIPNTNISGKVIVQLAYITGGFQAGTRQLLTITFDVAAGTPNGLSPLTFNDMPVQRQVRDSLNRLVESNFVSGNVIINTLRTTAAGASIAGRVVSATGRVIPRARVSITGTDGVVRTMNSNQFGRFNFENLAVGQTYVINVASKGFSFTPQTVSVVDNLKELALIADQ